MAFFDLHEPTRIVLLVFLNAAVMLLAVLLYSDTFICGEPSYAPALEESHKLKNPLKLKANRMPN